MYFLGFQFLDQIPIIYLLFDYWLINYWFSYQLWSWMPVNCFPIDQLPIWLPNTKLDTYLLIANFVSIYQIEIQWISLQLRPITNLIYWIKYQLTD